MTDRGQANLAALAVALVAVTSATALGVVVADDALGGATRTPRQRRAAVAAADRLVAGDAPTTRRPNVLDGPTVANLSLPDLDALAPPVRGRSIRVRLGDRTLVSRGDPVGGVTVRRVVLVADAGTRTRTHALADGRRLTLPRRTRTVRIDFGNATGVETVRANGRVALHDPNGLSGVATVRLSRYETTRLAFAGADLVGTVSLTTHPVETEKAVLAVTVDE